LHTQSKIRRLGKFCSFYEWFDVEEMMARTGKMRSRN
jgi:hypothetical protein